MVGLKGDNYYHAHGNAEQFHDYTSKIMVIDPSGRGKDETSFAVLYWNNGYIYLMDIGGFRDGYGDPTLDSLAKIAKKHEVNKIYIESNFGDGMFTKLLQPVVHKIHPVEFEDIRSSKQKEVRICDTLEPVLGSHKLVIPSDIIQKDYQTAKDGDGKHSIQYSCMYQLTRMSRDKGALGHDDRIDVLAMGVAQFAEIMSINSESNMDHLMEEFLVEHLERSIASTVNTSRSATVGNITVTWQDDDFGNNNMLGGNDWV
ncbi:hypothetical protein ERHA55_29440 [Erwinia rhapontici]|uniref:Terminase large subunit ribonuclease H-like domain-containing protein n=1 Tax=Erwinia rhapontici TaxID=55212 RepID=A0ABM7N1D8_ERWRD|nr:phage terminase large subunit [Erwinia rhapontici]BCQ35273.1 hypothetical protein ERHA53_26160 [Erwinia rhapontici]BCQ45417.1 hypothetical protein ERHA55_29440 [Erwinia rhapontici]